MVYVSTLKTPDKPTVLDAFCGAGGSSLGAFKAGCEVEVAINHDEIAISSHQANFPRTKHYCVDITRANAVDLMREASPLIFIASPECKYQGYSSGIPVDDGQLSLFADDKQNPVHQQSRMTMYQVYRYLLAGVRKGRPAPFAIIENVPSVVNWRLFGDWETKLRKLGYNLQFVNINAMHVGVPQSRDRLFLVANLRGFPVPDVQLRPLAVCEKCGEVEARQFWKKRGNRSGRYRAQYLYVCPHCGAIVEPPTKPVKDILDWTLPMLCIGEREAAGKKPLKRATLERIKAGIQRYVLTQGQDGFMAELRGTSTARSLMAPISTIATSGAHHQLVSPPGFLLQYYSRQTASSSLSEPIPTIPTENRHSLVSCDHHFLTQYYGSGGNSSVDQPIPTVPTRDRHSLVKIPGTVGLDLDRIVQHCSTRMLSTAEILAAMDFPHDYVVLGNQSQRKRQAGNAVCHRVAQFLCQRILAAAGWCL